MRAALRNTWLVGLIVVVFAALALVLWRSARRSDMTRDHSTFRKNAWGCAALAELLRTVEPRLKVTVRTTPLTDLPEVKGLLVILDPTQPFSDREIEEVVRWVERGGVLLVGVEGLWDDMGAASPTSGPAYVKLAGALGVAVERLPQPMTVARPAPGSPLGKGVTQVAIASHYRIEAWQGQSDDNEWATEELYSAKIRCLVPHRPADLTPHLLAEGRVILASFRHGRGRVYFTSDVQMLANSMLSRDDNLVFAANLIWPDAPAGSVTFDEYHHGFGPRRVTASVVDPAPLRRAALVVLAAAVIFLTGKAMRFGAPIAVYDPRRRTTREYIEGLADLWQRAEAHGFALRQIATAFRHRLAAEVGLRPTAPAEALAAALAARRGVAEGDVRSLLDDLERAQASRSVTEKEVVRLVGRVSELEARVTTSAAARAQSGQRPTHAERQSRQEESG